MAQASKNDKNVKKPFMEKQESVLAAALSSVKNLLVLRGGNRRGRPYRKLEESVKVSHLISVNEQEKISASEYFLLGSSLPFKSVIPETTLFPRTTTYRDILQSYQDKDEHSGTLQEKISEVLDKFNGSLHALAPLISQGPNKEDGPGKSQDNVRTEIVQGVLNYCQKIAKDKTRVSTCSTDSQALPGEKSQPGMNDKKFLGQTFSIITPTNKPSTIPSKNDEVPPEMLSRAEVLDPANPLFCSTPAEGKIVRTQQSKKIRRYCSATTKKSGNKYKTHSIRYLEEESQVVAANQEKVGLSQCLVSARKKGKTFIREPYESRDYLRGKECSHNEATKTAALNHQHLFVSQRTGCGRRGLGGSTSSSSSKINDKENFPPQIIITINPPRGGNPSLNCGAFPDKWGAPGEHFPAIQQDGIEGKGQPMGHCETNGISFKVSGQVTWH